MGLLSSITNLFGKGATSTAPKPANSSTFKNPFFSLKGQTERIGNVGSVLKAAVTGKGVSVTPKAKSIIGERGSKVLETIASHPFASAGVATLGITAVKAVTGKGAIGAKVQGMLGKGKEKPSGILSDKNLPQKKETPSVPVEEQAQEMIDKKKDNYEVSNVLRSVKKKYGKTKKRKVHRGKAKTYPRRRSKKASRTTGNISNAEGRKILSMIKRFSRN